MMLSAARARAADIYQDLVRTHQDIVMVSIPHYWLVHLEEKMLIVYRWSKEGTL